MDEAARREVEHSAALRKAVIRREQRPIEKALRVDFRSVHQQYGRYAFELEKRGRCYLLQGMQEDDIWPERGQGAS